MRLRCQPRGVWSKIGGTLALRENCLRPSFPHPGCRLPSSMGPPLLPQEIIDVIISQTDGFPDPELALVSKAFRPQVQRWRFSHITLDGHCLSMFARLDQILVRNPTLGEYVQTVSLVYDWEVASPASGHTEPGMAQAAPGLLGRILRACRVDRIVFETGIAPQQIVQLLSPQNVPHLRSLTLGKLTVIPMNTLHHVLSLHPPMRQLELSASHLYTWNAPSSSRGERLPLKRLHFNVEIIVHGDSWTFDDLYSVEEEFKIDVDALFRWHTDMINQALQTWGSTSRRLCFHVRDIDPELREL
jgi:hypothetical protein